ncbi:hypothetical protein POX_a01836 [Penicillium oxalicum]|uniref:Ribosome maturation protein SDO1/SBDS N-terminal domain-containing protein n=1 Tax=Penicillium oxalicum (strain 114-2 / CGMCC 5302) TaxID=933388 RepID=S7ZRU8_PENO1|nr:hypothetical protein POX_a01836 [Penicillium oxalicum]EPS33169.1 hypothetical protein PDE_08131 [Penicillium oxalicum 114-2]KAI2795231.1 hypothetical protein POX_a01836 [Penicillium oxalicum]
MPRANDNTHKIFFKGQSEDFIVFVDDLEILKKWKEDRSVPLTDVLNGWKIFVTHGHGAQGVLDTASKAALESEFGTSKEEECMVKILENGSYQTTTTRERDGSKNDSKGAVANGR